MPLNLRHLFNRPELGDNFNRPELAVKTSCFRYMLMNFILRGLTIRSNLPLCMSMKNKIRTQEKTKINTRYSNQKVNTNKQDQYLHFLSDYSRSKLQLRPLTMDQIARKNCKRPETETVPNTKLLEELSDDTPTFD
jgi:hypothetical protein